MNSSPHRTSVPLSAPDAVTLPVRVLAGIPLYGRRRPHPRQVHGPHPVWNNPPWPPPDGWYDVPTTWREILDAAITAGRDPAPWLSRFPALAAQELLARTSPLSAYLHHDGSGRPVRLRPSPVYTRGAERSAQGAMAYRLGMTMTEWVARVMIGLPPTLHYESSQPAGAGPNWYGPGKRPDLYSEASALSPALWCLEAKGARRLVQGIMRNGAQQLAALDSTVVTVPHGRVLVGTNIDPQLFTLVEHEKFTPRLGIEAESAEAIYLQARARLVTYLFLRSMARERLRTTVISRGGARTRFGETDEQTKEVRTELAREAPGIDPSNQRIRGRDMVVAELPGTGLRVGMSTGLFRACGAVLDELLAAIEATAAERTDWDRFAVRPVRQPEYADTLSPDEEDDALGRFRAAVEQRSRPAQMTRAYEAYDRGATDGIEDLVGRPARETETSDLELYTDDTYLSLSEQSSLMAPFTPAE